MDNDIDSLLLRQFSSMATQDRDVLIAEFRKLLGNHLNELSCAFYLDMNNWNLQDAICSYLEYSTDTAATIVRVPQMQIMAEDSRTDRLAGHALPLFAPPNTCLVKSWHILNAGQEPWPVGCCLRFVSGHQMSPVERIIIDTIAAGNSHIVRLDVTSPAECGCYKAQWRMTTITGVAFGEPLWVVLNVCDGPTVAAAAAAAPQLMSDGATSDIPVFDSLCGNSPQDAATQMEDRSEMTPASEPTDASPSSLDTMDES